MRGSKNGACLPIENKRRWGRIAAIPGAVEAKIGSASRRNRAIVRDIGHGNVAPRLGVVAIPELGNGLSIGEAPGQRPAIDRRAPGVSDG